MAMTIQEIEQVVNEQFPGGAQELTVALMMLKARMGVELAQGVQRLAQTAADQANQQAQTRIQQAQIEALAAQQQFDQIVAQMAGQG